MCLAIVFEWLQTNTRNVEALAPNTSGTRKKKVSFKTASTSAGDICNTFHNNAAVGSLQSLSVLGFHVPMPVFLPQSFTFCDGASLF